MLGVCVTRPRVVRVLNHDPGAFTQGLVYAEGRLYESTGTWEASSLRTICPETGTVKDIVAVRNDFAEGIAYMNERIYQLTWKSGRVLIYKTNPIEYIGEMRFQQEGWGLAAHNGNFIATDGSHRIRHLGTDFNINRTTAIRRMGLPFRHLNAITTVRDQAYANIWLSALIAQIDLTSGCLVRIIDCSELERIESPKTPHHILNGIAFNPERQTFFATGKCWKTLTEFKLNFQT